MFSFYSIRFALNNMWCLGVIFSLALTGIAGEEIPVSMKDGATLNVSLYNSSVDLSGMVEKLISIPPLSTVTLNVANIPILASFVLVQTHAYELNITLSYSEVLKEHGYINGTNVGLVQMTGPPLLQFFIYNGNVIDQVFVLLMVHAYGKNAPIPGGCNMEFSVEIAPYLVLHNLKSVITVDVQPASLPGIRLACDDYSYVVHLEVYRLYLPERDFSRETYFAALRNMSTVDTIREYGKLIPASDRGPSLRRTFSAYPGTGSVYAVIAIAGSAATAYVPAVTYACGNKDAPLEDMCQVLTVPFSKLLCAGIFFCGLLICFGGHRFFKAEMFLLGFLIAANAAYIIMAAYGSDLNEIALDLFTFFSGLGFGLFWLAFWVCFGIPILSVLLATLALGYVLASVVMFAGLGDVSLLAWDVNFWITFFCIVVGVSAISSPLMHKANILCCAILGAFAVIVPIDHYIGSNLKYIIVNTMRRAVVPEFSSAVIDPPFQWRDILLSIMWIVMSIAGAVVQFQLQRGKPPFPPPLFQRRESYTTSRRQALTLARTEPTTDRTPLVTDAYVSYGGSPDSVFSSPASQNSVVHSNSRISRMLEAFLPPKQNK